MKTYLQECDFRNSKVKIFFKYSNISERPNLHNEEVCCKKVYESEIVDIQPPHASFTERVYSC